MTSDSSNVAVTDLRISTNYVQGMVFQCFDTNVKYVLVYGSETVKVNNAITLKLRVLLNEQQEKVVTRVKRQKWSNGRIAYSARSCFLCITNEVCKLSLHKIDFFEFIFSPRHFHNLRMNSIDESIQYSRIKNHYQKRITLLLVVSSTCFYHKNR
jgi:hypothetical protein